MSNTGRTCKVHYTGTFNDGTKFDSSYDRGEPIEFVCGAGQMIPGFDQAVEGMNVGDIIDVHLRPEDAYGMPDPEAIIKAPLADMPGAENLEVGNQVYLANSMGQQFLNSNDTYVRRNLFTLDVSSDGLSHPIGRTV